MYKNFNDYIKKHNNEYNELKKQTSRAIKFYENKINELFRKINVISEYDMAKDESKPNLEFFQIPNEAVDSLNQKLSERIEELEKKQNLMKKIYSIFREISPNTF